MVPSLASAQQVRAIPIMGPGLNAISVLSVVVKEHIG